MESKAPHNFSSTDDTLRAAEAYFAMAAVACEQRAEQASAAWDREFLRHTSQACELLTKDLGQIREDGSQKVLQQWQQYAPDRPLPTPADADGLRERPGPVDDLLAAMQARAKDFEEYHAALQANARTPEAEEFHQSYRGVIERFRRDLNSAFQRGQDM